MSKEQERAELHRVIWQIANDLRGSVDGWDFKSYVLGVLFYRYISENITAYINEEQHKVGETDFDYTKLDDDTAENARESIVKEKGFFDEKRGFTSILQTEKQIKSPPFSRRECVY